MTSDPDVGMIGKPSIVAVLVFLFFCFVWFKFAYGVGYENGAADTIEILGEPPAWKTAPGQVRL